MSAGRPSATRALVHAAFFLSGAASLACEVVWFKLFGLAIGTTNQAASAVVTVFFVGLGIGAIAIGRVADRVERPLRLYGALELALAVASALTTLLLSRWADWIGLFRPVLGVEGGLAVKVGLAFALLAPPTVLMGSTLPLLSRWIVRSRDELGARVGTLYAVNTLGAALGCAVVGFAGIAVLGVQGAGLAASAVYAVIGVAALVASREDPPLVAAAPELATGALDGRSAALIAWFAASGFLSVSYEILWFRLLATATVNTVYVFASLLAVYLLGLWLGAVIAARWLASGAAHALRGFARAQLAVAVAGVVTLAALGRARTLLTWTQTDLLAPDGMLATAGLAFLILVVPSTLVGLTFPLASEITVTRLSALGSRLGLLYGANTVVGAFGALATGFVLIPWLGTQGTALALSLGSFALFAVPLSLSLELRAGGTAREGALGLVALVALHLLLGPGYLREAQTRIVGAEILAFREVADGTFLMVEYDERGTKYQQVIVNGTSYANNRPPGRHYMALLAHLPVLLHPDPEELVVICVGTGTTVGAASISDRVGRVSAVDLSAEIFALAPDFVPWNHAFHENPRVRRIVADGRHFLLVSPDAFDVLTFEPPPPIEAGVANLYTVEFYQLARQRAAPGAIVAQWIPFHQGFLDLQKELVASMVAEFPHVSLWMADNQEGILLGSDRPIRVGYEALAERMSEPDVARELSDIGLRRPEDVLALFVAEDEDLRAWLDGAAPMTDDRPTVERFLGRANTPFAYADLLAHRTPPERLIGGPLPDPEAAARSREAFGHLWAAADHAIRSFDFAAAAEAMGGAVALDPDNTYFRYRLDEYHRRVTEP